jgi:hypothetical protein
MSENKREATEATLVGELSQSVIWTAFGTQLGSDLFNQGLQSKLSIIT